MLYYHEITFLFFLSSYESFDYNETCLYFPYIFPILFDILFTRAFEHVKNADQKSLRKFARGWYPRAFLAAIYDYHGRSWGGQLGPDPAGFKRRCRIGPWHRVSAKVSRYISISWRTIPTLSARRKTALSPRHSFCKHVCIRVYPGRDAYIRRGVASTRLHNAWCWYWTRAPRNCEMRTTEN